MIRKKHPFEQYLNSTATCPPVEGELERALEILARRSQYDRPAAWHLVQCFNRQQVAAAMDRVRPLPLSTTESLVDSLAMTCAWRHVRADAVAARWAVATVCSAGYEQMALTMLKSLHQIGGLDPRDCPVVIFALDDGAYQSLLPLEKSQPGIYVVRLSLLPFAKPSPWIGVARWLAPQIFPGVENWMLVEADMLARHSMAAALNSGLASRMKSQDAIFGVAPQFWGYERSLVDELAIHQLNTGVLQWITGLEDHSGKFNINGGVQMARADLLTRLHEKVASWWPYSRIFCEGSAVHWGEEYLTNLAMERMDAVGVLPAAWNHQIYDWAKGIDYAPGTCDGQPVFIQHYAGCCPGGVKKVGFWRTAKHLKLIDKLPL